ncbi:hypothetical protein BKA93DRAFT_756282 [Sparassis latifolia]|uniref:BRCT domain-containing protein n=1 Tax=Sparassis crispa TaxID=139825 RepID=A0A401GGH4_9APHY|nr:hypothetical protein SCP_0309480 [Sparassis crispa]GBE81221.1 hypothetical protein SCP_0309480 [Sparassis crispa]
MAPARTTNRRTQREQNAPAQPASTETMAELPKDELFLEPMMGTPLAIYVEKDVQNRDAIVDLITKHGGMVSPGYSGVPYILVDPHKESGQNLFRQYVGKKGKIVLDANWVLECVKAGALQTYHNNWAGCKVTGTEAVTHVNQNVAPPQPGPPNPQLMHSELAHQMQPSQMMQPHMAPPPMAPPEALVHPQHGFQYTVYPTPMDVTPRAMHPPTAAPPQSWQAANGIAPQQTHMAPPPQPQPQMMPRHPQGYREDQAWPGAYHQSQPSTNTIVPNAPQDYDYNRYREEQAAWVGGTGDYYAQPYEQQAYPEPDAYMEEAGPSNAPDSSTTAASEKARGRKRVRTQPQPAPPASTLVVNRRNPPARSPTPPTRIIKSTYGGNLFTSDDVLYLKKYIDYCQEQGLVLSLREICERVAVKAPHHTFYSWRRYCNKHQIRLGGYAMDVQDGGNSPPPEEEQGQSQSPPDQEAQVPVATTGAGAIAAARRAAAADLGRTRSPTPPRALFRSTTGKGVAFTDEDVTFLVRFLEYRNRTQEGKIDMVAFWKDVAAKAPHHSRASWMKFYRRHKHELNHTEGDAPLPAPPEKKMRYSREDDVLLAKYFYNKPDGTSDKIFQAFGRLHPHHPWKGWQEHHRIHKAKIDHLTARFANGENIDERDGAAELQAILSAP